jgi:hypothetical protein
MRIRYLSFFAVLLLSCGNQETQSDLTAYLKEELKELKTKNEKLKEENEGLENEIKVLEKEIAQLKSRNAQTVSVNNPKSAQKNMSSTVQPANLAGQWKARLVFRDRTCENYGTPGDAITETWGIILLSEKRFRIAKPKKEGTSDSFWGEKNKYAWVEEVELSGNRLIFKPTSRFSSFFVKSKNEIRGETVVESGNCSVTYSVTLTRQ